MTREKWAKMSADEKQIKVAELCGWWLDGDTVKSFFWRHPRRPEAIGISGVCGNFPPARGLPDYENDLNAMSEAERTLVDYGKRALYINWVYGIICRDKNGRMFDEDGICPTDTLIFASAAQRSEAFVLTMDTEKKDAKNDQQNS